ncbi:hypothetical protein [Pseudomonas fluorescens]|uniref:Transmembrane protein n=1 Tax=Pseudomonas fluorescens TaxID=294 RepID=A0A5E6UXJ4_PSEFL|nr:hypothetical protein [Pseudomonas fluorescens]VVN05256.1 hypothetical protein PS624_03540 [Pseudomonas fluorescens]
MQETKPGSTKEKLKKRIIAAIVLLLAGAWLNYIPWAAGISARTILMPQTPELTTYLLVGALFGIVFSGLAIRAGKTARGAIKSFLGGFCFGLICSLNIYDVSAYLLSGEVVSYESEYEITFPGPSKRCEAGLWINGPNTQRRIELCTNKKNLNEQIGRGIYAVWVTAHTNKLGSYIIGYTFFRK